MEYFKKAQKADSTYQMADYNLAVTYNNLAKEFNEKGEMVLARGLLYKSIASERKFFPAYSNLSDVLMHLAEWEEVSKYGDILDALTQIQLKNQEKSPQTPFLNILRIDDPAENLIIAKSWEREISGKAMKYKLKNKPKAKKSKVKIKVGYVSDGFRDFPTGHNLLDVIKLHNRNKFEIYLYNHGDNDGSYYRKAFERLADSFTDIVDWNVGRAIQKIIDDRIDILVDLKGHTQGGNLEIFARRPGKVQISWLGFPGTTGMAFIDYAVVDRVVVPKGEEKYWSEKLIFMPDCYRPVDTGTPLGNSKLQITKSKHGLPEGKIVFSSFNNAYKIEPVMWEVWMTILRRVPNSILWLWERFPEATRNLKKYARKYAIDPKRLIFTGRLPKDKHLSRIALADIALDTRVVNGHTTTAETIRMGVPVIALYGKHFCSRVSASILTACGMNELVTHSLKEYEDLAVAFANSDLQKVKQKLRKNLKTYPLLNTKLFTKNLEKGYLAAWNRYEKSLKPKHLYVR